MEFEIKYTYGKIEESFKVGILDSYGGLFGSFSMLG